ncbi:hypothetical protein [Aerosakkonema sp. BLCC-F183]|uniref:hypothetical protein n=1 Tax=Aerosakkonema sp. BLCC-F183 TaxID=3342834 RepID=UPI0035BC4153
MDFGFWIGWALNIVEMLYETSLQYSEKFLMICIEMGGFTVLFRSIENYEQLTDD